MVLILTPAAPGWFVWVLPFLVFHQLKGGPIAVGLVSGFGLLYIGLNACVAPIPAIPALGWSGGGKLIEMLGFPDRLWSLWQTLLLGSGLIIAARMVREGIHSNEYFRLSRKPFLIGIAGDSVPARIPWRRQSPVFSAPIPSPISQGMATTYGTGKSRCGR